MGTTELPVEGNIASWFADNAKSLAWFAFFLIWIKADRCLVGLHVAALEKVATSP